MQPSISRLTRSLSLKRLSAPSSEQTDSSAADRWLLALRATIFLLLPTVGASVGRTPGAGIPVGELLEEARGAASSTSEGMSMVGAAWTGAAKFVSSTLALFADPEVAAPFLFWALMPRASIRAASASIPKKKKKGGGKKKQHQTIKSQKLKKIKK